MSFKNNAICKTFLTLRAFLLMRKHYTWRYFLLCVKKCFGFFQWSRCVFAYRAGKWDPITSDHSRLIKCQVWTDGPKAFYLCSDHSECMLITNVYSLCVGAFLYQRIFSGTLLTSRTSSYSSRPWHSMKLRAAEGISSVRFHRALRANFRVESTTPTMAFCCTRASSCCETQEDDRRNVKDKTAKNEKRM